MTRPRGHRHQRPDASPDWRDCVGLLPGMDRWGWIDPTTSMHRSSLSVQVRAMQVLLDTPTEHVPVPKPVPARPVRHIGADEEERILARADELCAQVAAILDECG